MANLELRKVTDYPVTPVANTIYLKKGVSDSEFEMKVTDSSSGLIPFKSTPLDVVQYFEITTTSNHNLNKNEKTNVLILTGTAGNVLLSGIDNCLENQRISIINQTDGLINILNNSFSSSVGNRFLFSDNTRRYKIEPDAAASFIYEGGYLKPADNSREYYYSGADISYEPSSGAFGSVTYANDSVFYYRSGNTAMLSIVLSTSGITQGTASGSVRIKIDGTLADILFDPNLYGFADYFPFNVRFNSGAPFVNPPRVASISYSGSYPSGDLYINLSKSTDIQDVNANTALTVSDMTYASGTRNQILISGIMFFS